MKTMLGALALLPLLAGCETTYNVKAYDLKGEKIYDGQLIHSSGGLHTPDGRSVVIQNATVVMEEVK